MSKKPHTPIDNSDTWSVDSKEEGLGKMSAAVARDKRFAARVSYDEQGIPTLNLIPSTWRYATSAEVAQGDHVSAYILMLETLTSCKGENIKKLPDILYKLATSLIPEERAGFKKLHDDVIKNLSEHRTIRKDTTGRLRAENFLHTKEVKEMLKKQETEIVARHVEDVADKIISLLNEMESSAFSNRKEASIPLVREGMKKAVDRNFPNSATDNFEPLRKILKTEIDKLETTTERPRKGVGLVQVADAIVKEITDTITKDPSFKIPEDLKTQTKRATNQEKILGMLKEITPLKKESESDAIGILRRIDNDPKNYKLQEIAVQITRLFDYAKTGDRDDEKVLYEAIPKHLAIIFSAFKNLQTLPTKNKTEIYEGFLDRLLEKQLWSLHKIKDEAGATVTLTRDILKKEVGKVAEVNFSTNEIRLLPRELRGPIKTEGYVEDFIEAVALSTVSEEIRQSRIAKGETNLAARKIIYQNDKGEVREVTQKQLIRSIPKKSLDQIPVEESRLRLLLSIENRAATAATGLLSGTHRDPKIPTPVKPTNNANLEVVGSALFTKSEKSGEPKAHPQRRLTDPGILPDINKPSASTKKIAAANVVQTHKSNLPPTPTKGMGSK